MEKRDNEILMQSPGRWYLAMQGETTSIKVRFCSRCMARKKGRCIDRKQESIFESEAWTYISCSRPNTNSVFRRVLYRRERRAATWLGESKFFYFLFSAAVTKTGGWTTSLDFREADRESVESERDNKRLRLNSQRWNIMDQMNAIILCIMFKVWYLNPEITKDSNLGTIRQKLCCIASCSMTKHLARIRCSSESSPSLCCLQGISFRRTCPWAESLPRFVRHLGVYEVYYCKLPEPSTRIGRLGLSWHRADFHFLKSKCHWTVLYYEAQEKHIQ